MVGRRQCGPKLLTTSESTIRGPLHVSLVNRATSVPYLHISFLAMCSYENPGRPAYRNCYKEKSVEARSRKPSQRDRPGSYVKNPKQSPPPVRSLGSEEQLLSHIPSCLVPISCALYNLMKGTQDNRRQKLIFKKIRPESNVLRSLYILL